MQQSEILSILIADDDRDDWEFATLAFAEAAVPHTLKFVANGDELMHHLYHAEKAGAGFPDMILLDLNMPKKDGREALKEIKADPSLRHLNVVIFSTTISEEDKAYTTRLGVTRHITKPFQFSDLVATVKELCESFVLSA